MRPRKRGKHPARNKQMRSTCWGRRPWTDRAAQDVPRKRRVLSSYGTPRMESHVVLASLVRERPTAAHKNSRLLSSEPEAFRTGTVSEQYYLPRHVYACSLPGGLLFVDLLRNRYFCIGENESKAIGPHIVNHSIAR